MIGISYFIRNKPLALIVLESLDSNALLIDLDNYNGEAVDELISVGGDGTFAKSVSTINFDKILGIRPTTSVGAQCSCNINEWPDQVEKFLSRDYKIEERGKLISEVNGNYVDSAVNDVLIAALKWGRTLKYELMIGQDESIPTSGSALFLYTRIGYSGFLEKLLNPYGLELIDAGVQKFGAASIASNYGFNEHKELNDDFEAIVKITNKWGGAYLGVDGAKTELELRSGDAIRITGDDYKAIIF